MASPEATSERGTPERVTSVGGEARRRPFVVLGLVLGALLVALALDLSRAPSRQASARLLLFGIDVYQERLAPWSAAVGARCRFEPTCSHYGEAVIRRYGAGRGSWLAARRIARCGPWTSLGTQDPPP